MSVFRDKPQAFLALPKDQVSAKLGEQIAFALTENGIESLLPNGPTAGMLVPQQVQTAIRAADVVVADLTGKNPNVLFEVGIAFGLGKPVLLLSQERLSDAPPDLLVHQIARYRPEDMGSVRRYVELWSRDVLARRENAAS